MSFAAPWLGWLGAVAGPVILFYLIRQRLRPQPVSTLLFWHQLQPRVHSTPLWRKLRRWFSLLLQLLFVLLLVLALCRPLLPWQSATTGYLVVVLDPSVSMTATGPDGERWAEAVAAAEARIDAMTFYDEAALVLAGDPPRILSSWTGRRADLKAALQEAKPVGTATDIRPALALARNLAASREGGEVEVITDGVWAVMPEEEELAGTNLRLLGKREDNAGLTLFAVRRSVAAPGEYQMTARVENNTEAPVSGQLELLRDGGLIDVVPIELEPGKPWTKDWTAQHSEAAQFSARFIPDRTATDALAADDTAATALPPVSAVSIELVSEPNGFLETALTSQPLANWTRTWPPESMLAMGGDEAAAADRADPRKLFIFHNVAPPEGFSARNVILLNPPTSGFWGDRSGEIDQPLISDSAKDTGVLRFADFSKVQVRDASAFEPPPGAEVFVESFGQPLIFGDWEGDQRWLALGFDLTTSDLFLRTAFPILLGNVVQSLREGETASTAALPGPVESLLEATVPEALAAEAAGLPAPSGSWWASLPLWWWLVAGGFIWLLAEWFLYSRRITE